jgi:Holliday junction resolvase
MTNYTAGRNLEYKVRDALEADGYQCIRAAGSKGKADLVCIKPGEVLLIQVKKTDPQIRPADRAALLELARITGSIPIVAYKPFRKNIVYRQLTGPGPKDHRPWFPDRVGVT